MGEIKGIIKYLHLEDLWKSLTPEEQQVLIINHDSSPIIGNISSSSATPLGYIWGEITWADAAHNYTLARKLITYGEKIYKSASYLDKHFFCMNAAESYYKQRELSEDALALCEKYSLMDLEIFEKHGKSMSKEWAKVVNNSNGFDGRITSYKRLAILYEKSGRFKEAIQICERAIKFNQTDGTKGGFEGRIEKLKTKV